MDIKNIQTANFLETEPEKIILIKVIDQNFYEGRIVLINVSNINVIYRIFNERSNLYSISPSVYFIRPFEKFTVNIKRFGKVSIDQLKSKESFLLVALETSNEVSDISDAKNYLKKEEIYSPNLQQLELEVEFDNGSNSNNYYNMIDERLRISKEYNEKVNINNIKNEDEIKRMIEVQKEEIESYKKKIEDLLFSLKDVSTNNVVTKPGDIFDRAEFEMQMNKNMSLEKGLPVFIVVFIMCVGLFIGKIIAMLI